ncbi:MAG: bifunctional folylpolyglutamate synthase/dihydrofolate synthase [Lachnospiraceae bacterium]|nr:bifunctional folylpolyglutamate synthase/dihydrofolate synthase [Lachnospiraceae bacterium]
MNYNECVKYILDIPKFNKIKSNENCYRILERLGNPHKKFKVFHVAGTNGKGSVCAFINSILLSMGKSVGLFTSPHLVKINERVKVDGKDISDEDFCETFFKVKTVIEELYGGKYLPTFFEYIFLMAVTYFSDKNVEYAVLEVGMGGRLDATNIIENPIATIITTISMDHMEILGDTIEKIAGEKAGIIKKAVPVFYFGDNITVDKVICEKAEQTGASAIKTVSEDITILGKNNKAIDFSISNMYDRYGCFRIPFVMEYQTVNAALAINAVNYVLADELKRKHIVDGLNKTIWQGRMEEIKKNIYLDGAHNYEGIEQFVKYANEISKDRSIYILFSVVKEKEYNLMMDLIAEIKNCKGYLVAPVQNARALVVEEMSSYLKQNVNAPVYSFSDLKEAVTYAEKIKDDDEVLFCVGSLYMVGEIKAIFGGNYDKF